MRYVFGECELDTQRYELRKAGILQPLAPQEFKVLTYLLAHRERVVTKRELVEHLWPDEYVSDATLTQRVVAVRRALGDDGRTQRYIRTAQRRGYHFVADVVEHTEPAPLPPTVTSWAPPALPATGKQVPMFVGRDTELALLHTRWEQALQGQRQCIFVSGEAGIGKTTLVDTFLAQLQANTAVWVGRGQCVEHYGTGEAYLPLLEALGRLGRGPGGALLGTALRQHAPSWLAHLPALVAADEADSLPRSMQGITRERMVRELAEALESVTATQPLLIVLEDVHWSDMSTVNWLSYVARRRDRAQLCILGTYRPSDALGRAHPLPAAVQELQRQGHAVDIPLPPWSLVEVTAYLVQRFSTLPFSGEVMHFFHQHTRGNPFFLVTAVEAMASQGQLADMGLHGQMFPGDIPDSIRHLIEYQFESLCEADQAFLETASVAGESFATAEVAAALGQTIDAVETQCALLARKGQFLYAMGLDTWPDSTRATRYGFRHALYHEVLYTRLAPGRRLRMHQQIGLHKERAYGARAHDIAAELAAHFVRGQDLQRSVHYLYTAANNAFQRCAYQEALQQLESAFPLLPQLPEGAARTQQALALHFLHGRTLMLTKGYAAPEVEHAYRQAVHLGQQLGDTPHLLPGLHGLWSYYYVRGDLQQARELAERCFRIACQADPSAFPGGVRYALGATLFSLGELESTCQLLAQELAWYNEEDHQPRAPAPVIHDGQLVCLSIATAAWWCRGDVVQARQYRDQLLAGAQRLGGPFELALAFYVAANLAHCEGDSRETQRQTERLLALATEQNLPFWAASGAILRGWALVCQQREDGLVVLQHGLHARRATGAGLTMPHYLGILADAYGMLHQVEQGLAALEEALAIVAQTGEAYYVAELHRLRGVLLLQQATSAAQRDAAAQCFQQALTVARQQQARALALRAAVSLGHLWQAQGHGAAAQALVEEIAGEFPDAAETADLRAARALLNVLGGARRHA